MKFIVEIPNTGKALDAEAVRRVHLLKKLLVRSYEDVTVKPYEESKQIEFTNESYFDYLARTKESYEAWLARVSQDLRESVSQHEEIEKTDFFAFYHNNKANEKYYLDTVSLCARFRKWRVDNLTAVNLESYVESFISEELASVGEPDDRYRLIIVIDEYCKRNDLYSKSS